MKYEVAGVEYDTNKWRCNDCDTVFEFGKGAWDIEDHCPICGNNDPDTILEPIYAEEKIKRYLKAILIGAGIGAIFGVLQTIIRNLL